MGGTADSVCLAGTARFLILGDGDGDLEPAGFFQKNQKKNSIFPKSPKEKPE